MRGAWRAMVPERVEAIEVVHRALDRLEDSRGLREIEEALSRMSAAIDALGQRVTATEERTRARASDRVAGMRARGSAVREALQRGGPLPKVDAWLTRLGLMRLAMHQRELETTRRRAQRAGARKARAAMHRAAGSGTTGSR